MELKIKEKSNIDFEANSKNKTHSHKTSFSDTLNSVINDSKCTELSDNNKDTTKISTNNVNERTGISVIDNLSAKNNLAVNSAMKDINNILGLNPYNYLKDDSTLDIRRMIQDFDSSKSKLSFRNLEQLKKAVNTLYENELLDDDNYFFIIQWIELQMQALKMKEKAEDTVIAVLDETNKLKVNLKNQK